MAKTLVRTKKQEYETLIYEFRGRKVMVDYDLALLYDVPNKRLKEQVRRNKARFPEDFMFELTGLEKKELIQQSDRLAVLKFSAAKVMVFTELGVAMLSSVLSSDKAILMNIEIMRAFANYRSVLKENENLKRELNRLDEKMNQGFNYLIEQINKLHYEKDNREQIGYKLTKRQKD